MNVLSIDFDIIMAPDIQLYNNLVGGSKGHSDLVINHPMLASARADLYTYQKLVIYLMSIIQEINVADIRVAHGHNDIENLIKDDKDVHIFSFDHHHDCGYGENKHLENFKECSCANWVRFYHDAGVITNYTWIKNTNSETEEIEDLDYITTINIHECDLTALPKFDKLFICLSPEWVPEQYHALFFLMLDLINQNKGCMLQFY